MLLAWISLTLFHHFSLSSVGFKSFYEGQWLRARLCCRKISDSIFWLHYFTPRWLAGGMPCPKKVHKKYTKRKDRNIIRDENISFILSFIYLVNGLTNATSQNIAWCPKHQTVRSVLSVRRHYPKRGRFTENLSIYLSSPAPNSPLQNHSNFGAIASHWPLYILLFFFFSDFNRMDAWSLMHGDAFIHFVSGSRRVNIRLGVFTVNF